MCLYLEWSYVVCVCYMCAATALWIAIQGEISPMIFYLIFIINLLEVEVLVGFGEMDSLGILLFFFE